MFRCVLKPRPNITPCFRLWQLVNHVVLRESHREFLHCQKLAVDRSKAKKSFHIKENVNDNHIGNTPTMKGPCDICIQFNFYKHS